MIAAEALARLVAQWAEARRAFRMALVHELEKQMEAAAAAILKGVGNADGA